MTTLSEHIPTHTSHIRGEASFQVETTYARRGGSRRVEAGRGGAGRGEVEGAQASQCAVALGGFVVSRSQVRVGARLLDYDIYTNLDEMFFFF